jgi:3-carboxy-cis,cis-muconate cycloisomerase
VTDTALVLLLRRCRETLAAVHRSIDRQLSRISEEHAASVMLGRLHGEPGENGSRSSLLMQYEVGEAAESAGGGRGGSSTMPNKRNPTACMLTLAVAHRIPGLVANFLSGTLQEHERVVGGCQAEWSTVAGIGRRYCSVRRWAANTRTG